MTPKEWEAQRDNDGTFPLCKIYKEHNEGKGIEFGTAYIEAIEDLQPIKSRQVAGLIWTTAAALDTIMEEK